MAAFFLSNFDRSFCVWWFWIRILLLTLLLCRMLLERSCHLPRRVQEEFAFSLPMELSRMSPYANLVLLVAFWLMRHGLLDLNAFWVKKNIFLSFFFPLKVLNFDCISNSMILWFLWLNLNHIWNNFKG